MKCSYVLACEVISPTFVALCSHNQSPRKQRPSMQPSSWTGSPCSPSECAQLHKRKDKRLACTHSQYYWQVCQIRPRQTTFYVLATRSVHAIHITHQMDTRTFNIWISCVCVQTMCACVCFLFFQCKHRAISPDQTLVCSWHGLLGYDTSRETQRTQ